MKYVKRVVHIAVFAAMIVLMVSLCTVALKDRYTGQWIMDGFLDQPKNSLDVIFFGSSNMYRTVRPAQLLEQTGIEGWNCGASSQFASATELYVKVALQRQTPRVAVIETLGLTQTTSIGQLDETKLYWSLTPLPLSKEKLSFLWKAFDGDLEQVLPYALNLYQFHSRWETIDFSDEWQTARAKKQEFLASRGYRASEEIFPINRSEIENPPNLDVQSLEAYRNMIAHCRAKGVEVVLFKSPVADWSEEYTRQMSEFAKEMGVPFIDYNDPALRAQLDLNDETDFCDDVHVNVWGAQKVTAHLGKFLQENYFKTA